MALPGIHDAPGGNATNADSPLDDSNTMFEPQKYTNEENYRQQFVPLCKGEDAASSKDAHS